MPSACGYVGAYYARLQDISDAFKPSGVTLIAATWATKYAPTAILQENIKMSCYTTLHDWFQIFLQ